MDFSTQLCSCRCCWALQNQCQDCSRASWSHQDCQSPGSLGVVSKWPQRTMGITCTLIGENSYFLTQIYQLIFFIQDSEMTLNKQNSVIFSCLYKVSVTKYSNNLGFDSINTTVFFLIHRKILYCQIRFLNLWLIILNQNNGFCFFFIRTIS